MKSNEQVIEFLDMIKKNKQEQFDESVKKCKTYLKNKQPKLQVLKIEAQPII